jgi:DNA repair exonuclease SbcCD ATPase subunit
MENNPNAEKDTKKVYVLLVVIALLIATNVFLWLQKNKSETKVEQTTDEKSKLQSELDQLEVDLNTATANADTLNQNLIAKDEELKGKVAELQAALKRGKMNTAQLSKAKNEIDQLRYYINKYQEQIAALKKENEDLTNENSGLKQTVESEQKKSSDLLNKNISLSNKVAVAEILKPTSLIATGIKFRSNGKESATDRVKSLEKIKINFTLADNQVAATGNKDFFIRIINPENKAEVVTDANESKFNANGEALQYSVKRSFDFQNNPSQEYSIYWTKGSSLNPGDYTILLYADGTSIGKTILKLK